MKIYIRHIQLFGTKIDFDIIGISVKYILANISHFYKKNICKIYFNYTTFSKIYFIYFDIYVTYLFFHVGQQIFERFSITFLSFLQLLTRVKISHCNNSQRKNIKDFQNQMSRQSFKQFKSNNNKSFQSTSKFSPRQTYGRQFDLVNSEIKIVSKSFLHKKNQKKCSTYFLI